MTENFVKIYYSFNVKEEVDQRSECIINANVLPRIVDVKPNNIPALKWLAKYLVEDDYGVHNFQSYIQVYLWDQNQSYLGRVDFKVVKTFDYIAEHVEVE